MRKEEMVRDIVRSLGNHGYKTRGLRSLLMHTFLGHSHSLRGIWYFGCRNFSFNILVAGLRNKGIPLERVIEVQADQAVEKSEPSVITKTKQEKERIFLLRGGWQCPRCGMWNLWPDTGMCYQCDSPRAG